MFFVYSINIQYSTMLKNKDVLIFYQHIVKKYFATSY